jgi:hypothetical protein
LQDIAMHFLLGHLFPGAAPAATNRS